MNDYAWVGQVTAPVAVAAGILACFWGYRVLKIVLGITGFLAGASAGWTVGLALAPGNQGIALIGALIAGLLGALLCIWLFFLGIFLLGAAAGTVIAAALFGGAGHPANPILFLAFALVFGVLALALQKFMIIFSTAFGGSYLITAGILHFVAGQSSAPPWFELSPSSSAAGLGYVALALWLVLGLVGVSVQYKSSLKRPEPVPQPDSRSPQAADD